VDRDDAQFAEVLARARDSLVVLARMHLDRRLWGKLDPEDLAQQTFEEACAERDRLRGWEEGRLRAWLRTSLLHNVYDALRHFRRGKCDAALERPLEASSARLLESLAAAQSTPSQRAARNEALARLAEALPRLPPDQQQAVILHHLQGQSLAEVAEQLGKSLTATAGLVHRGLKALQRALRDGGKP
jgi:RNA polymerase sigma-70 factor (ECF subfamily)